jgi:hypothetical protein
MRRHFVSIWLRVTLFSIVTLVIAAITPIRGLAQSSTASLRGIITSTGGAPVPGARVELVSTQTGLRRSATTTSAGFYNIGAVTPGPYTVRALRIGMAPEQRNVILQIGEAKTLDFTMNEAAAQLEAVNITARAAGAETKTSEVGANVSTAQIENLPQNNRNFLDFAALAPGVQRRAAGISSGGASVNNSNLFVDGATYKSDVLPGGIAGQDPSLGRTLRGVGTVIGNPFPQNAVQEFRVITQNYKAEYNKATGAVVTAATKSGTNTTHGDLFSSFQNQAYLARSYWDIKDNFPKPRYNRTQFGGSIGGPIIRDKAHYFASYEGNYINLDQRVQFRPPTGLVVPDSLLTGQGVFGQPLRSNLFFGKADYQLNDKSSLILTANIRHDRDQRDFGGTTAETGRTTVGNDVNTVMLRHTLSGQRYTNEAQVSYQQFRWKAEPVNPGLVRREYQVADIIRGGNTSFQDFDQRRLSLRDDITRTASSHVVKGGLNLDLLNYDIVKQLLENPVFRFNPNQPGGFNSPFEAQLQIGDPNLKTNNQQFGAYLQDDWAATKQLTLNLGLRWDFETDQLNNTFVTPQRTRDSVNAFLAQHPFFSPNDYFTNGTQDRPRFYGAFQPRLGFSFDVRGDARTVVFGGAGLFYDRNNYNAILDEKYRFQRPQYTFRFSPTGNPAQGVLKWDPSYLSREGLTALINSGQYNNPDVYLLKNDTRPPKSFQGSIGARQAFGPYQLSVTGTMVNTYNGLKWMFGNRDPITNDLFFGQHGISAIVISTDEAKTWYKALLFQLSRPMLADTRWGGDLAYTLASSETNTYFEEDMFAFDYRTPADFTRVPGRFDERHRIVLNLIGRLPLGFLASTVTTLGSGVPYTLSTNCDNPNDTDAFCKQFPKGNGNNHDFDDNPPGKGPRSEQPEGKWFGPFGKWAYRNVDFRLQKDFQVRDQKLGIVMDAYNIFNFTNFNYDNFQYNLRYDGTQTPPRQQIPFSTFDSRRVQIGLKYSF